MHERLALLGAEDHGMDVAAWLRGLGLEQYAPAFRDNDVDGEVLPELTADDLISIGVTSVGHRRKLLAAIAALGTEPPTVAQSAASATSDATSHPAIDAERRQLTVMFCDLVGSTALSTRHDPEDLRELIGAYHHAVADTVGRFDGFVAKYMGDGVLIYFGYPQAHEDDAERAVRAGLAVIEAVGRLPAQQDLRVRLGIATGLAVVGDLLGEGAAQERGVVGETPNLAARLQALAAPNTLVIAEATRRQVGGLFDLADLGPQALAGSAEPQSAWRVIGESGMLSRFEALRSGETPLVGRGDEIELLLRRWEQAKTGEGRVVLISGEPGIGKSRLTAALSERRVQDSAGSQQTRRWKGTGIRTLGPRKRDDAFRDCPRSTTPAIPLPRQRPAPSRQGPRFESPPSATLFARTSLPRISAAGLAVSVRLSSFRACRCSLALSTSTME
jgi:class 3 adenylate cyclase